MKDNNFIVKLNDWFKGIINRKGEEEMEAFAQQDSFAKDALEGYRSFPESDHTEAINRLHKQLRQRSSKKAFLWVKIAASVVFILALGTMFWTINDSGMQKGNAIAEVNTIQNHASERSIHAETTESELELDSNSEDVSEERSISEPEKIRPTKRIEGKREKSITPPLPPKKEIKMQEDIPEEEVINVFQDKTKNPTLTKDRIEPPPPPSPIIYEDIVLDGITIDTTIVADSVRLFIGIVKSEDNEPIDGVKITAFGTNATTLTNENGRFVVEYTPDIRRLMFEYDNYEPLNIPVSGPKNITLHLAKTKIPTEEPERMFSKKKRAAVDAVIDMPIISPPEGYDEFDKTIENAIQYPKEAREKNIEGNVELSFIILPDGRISNIRILESPHPLLSAEAVRIFKNLPPWINNTGKSRILTYSIPFKISK